ncbi:coiled-coil domain-containing protein 148-like, partial [Elysia marginata]
GLVQRITDGLGSNKYKPVDYDRLKAMVSEKRFGSIKTSMKVAKIEQKSQQHKENSILKQHQLVWQKEFLRLQHLRKKADADVENHMRNNRDSDICNQIYKDFDYCDAGLSADFDAFKKATADPVWNLSHDECGNWDPEDHFQFVAIHDQYPRELPNRRALLFDRLKRHLPRRSRSSLCNHEDWWMDYKYYYERLKGIYVDWARDRRELLSKVQMVFSEAAVAQELEDVRREYYHRQKLLCEVLYEKVRQWREQKMEALQLELQLNEERRQIAQEREAQEKEAEQKKRSKEKQQIEDFKQGLNRKRLEREEAAEQRLKELKKLMAEQAVHDKERILFREKQLTEKLEERKRKEEEKEKESEELEARLEALREQVRVIAESDPSRTQQPTKAWDAHVHPEDDEETALMEPLFKMHTYTSKQITSDHRVKLESRLREAGLHNTDYARRVIRGATPPTMPRRDQFHTFKFKDQ